MSSGYRPSSSEPKGRWARHIHAFRKAHGWSQTKGFRESRAGLGFSENSRAAYVALDMGLREPTPAEEQALAEVYGWPSEEVEPTPSVDPTTDLIGLVRSLLGELAEERATRRAWEQGFLEAMRELATAAARPGDRAPAPPADARR